jgi:hypothetical protein
VMFHERIVSPMPSRDAVYRIRAQLLVISPWLGCERE